MARRHEPTERERPNAFMLLRAMYTVASAKQLKGKSVIVLQRFPEFGIITKCPLILVLIFLNPHSEIATR
ncbi:MAG: hypothetical protein AAF530_09210 [Pseudomonadota bacterium]